MTAKSTLNLERRELRAHGVHAKMCARLKLNSKRAHPPIPPRGRALSLRPRELEARARLKFALRIANRYFPAADRRRGPREQQPNQTEFVSTVRFPVPTSTGAGSPTGLDVGPCRNGAYWVAVPTTRRPFATRANVGEHGARSRQPAARMCGFPEFSTIARRQTP